MPEEKLSEQNETVDPLEAANARRAKRKAAAAEARNAQLVIDTNAIADIEELRGDASVRAIDVPHHAGLVAKIAVRCPEDFEIKRYRVRTKVQKDGKPGDQIFASEEIGESCLVYPSAEQFAKLCAVLPGIKGQCGMEAVNLSVGEAEKTGKG